MAETILFQETRGGARKGAGRKQGTSNVKTRALADNLAAKGETLLEICVNYVKQWAANNEHEKAYQASIPLLPYLHPRLAAMAVQTTKTELTLAELIEQSFHIEKNNPQILSHDLKTITVEAKKIESIDDLV